MTDVNLDDLILKDKTDKKNQKKNVAKKGDKQTGPRRRVKVQGKKPIRDREFTPRVERDRSPVQQEPREDGRKLRVIGLHPNITSTDLFVVQILLRNYSINKELLIFVELTKITLVVH